MRPGRIAAIVLVAAWVGLLAFHLWQNYAPAAAGTELVLDSPLGPGITQRGVYYRGSRIGFMREKLVPDGDGVRAEQEGRFTLNVMGRKRVIDLGGSASLSRGGKLEEFSYRLETMAGRSPFETEVSGRVEDGELILIIRTGDNEREERRSLAKPIVLPLNLYHALASQGLEAGKTFRLQLFDPMTLTEGEAEITVLEPEIVHWGGREERAFRLRSRFSGLATTAWVNEEGQLLKEETPLGWTLVREAPGSSLEAQSSDAAPEVLAASAIPAKGQIEYPEKLKRVRLRLNEFPPLQKDVQGGRQEVDGNEVVITLETLPPSRTEELSEDQRQSLLDSDAFIQADNPQVSELAFQLTADLAPLDAAQALSNWVHENIQKTPTLSIPNAVEVLENRTGDCNEHAVLYTALARAAGIPTRLCTGLAWTGGKFYYHAWPEVWVGGWLAVDPTFGQFPADPLHLRLLTGGLETQYEILNFMGRDATIDIVETE
jgi:hypothetical protein